MSLDVYLNKTCTCGETTTEVFTWNITHNLGNMAGKAGIYEALWRPEEIQATKAKDLIKPLEKGLKKLNSKPEYYQQFNPANGWGDYTGLVRFVSEYLEACKNNPEAIIEISR